MTNNLQSLLFIRYYFFACLQLQAIPDDPTTCDNISNQPADHQLAFSAHGNSLVLYPIGCTNTHLFFWLLSPFFRMNKSSIPAAKRFSSSSQNHPLGKACRLPAHTCQLLLPARHKSPSVLGSGIPIKDGTYFGIIWAQLL